MITTTGKPFDFSIKFDVFLCKPAMKIPTQKFLAIFSLLISLILIFSESIEMLSIISYDFIDELLFIDGVLLFNKVG